MFGSEGTRETARNKMVFEQLEERIVFDGAVEAVAFTWEGPTPGEGIFDGEFHRIEDRTFVFLEDQLHGVGVGYWWDPNNDCWGWALDFETGWWWENRGAGWDWMNCAWWDFEQYANAGVCVFDGQERTDPYGMEFYYDQANDEMRYTNNGVWSYRYEFGSATDSDWGWHRWSLSGWEPFGGNLLDTYCEFNGYSGHTAQCMWTGNWYPLPGGHGQDWTASEFAPAGFDYGTIYKQYFWLDRGLDFVWNASSGWDSNTDFTPSTYQPARYIGDGLMVFENQSYNEPDGREWIVYDGDPYAGDEWFRYTCWDYDAGGAWGATDFGPTLQLAFLGLGYDANEEYLNTNVIAITDGYSDYMGGSHANIYQIRDMMATVSQANANLYFDTVMIHDSPRATGFWMGSTQISVDTVDNFGDAFTDMGAMMLGDGENRAYFEILNSDAADTADDIAALDAARGYLNVDSPYDADIRLYASVDTTGNGWDGVNGHDPNWLLEYTPTFDPDNPYQSYLSRSYLLYDTDATAFGATVLAGD